MPTPHPTGPMLSSFQVSALAAGDIVFVYTRPARVLGKVIRFVNVTGQRILASRSEGERLSLKARLPRYSHVMLGVGGGLVVHADGKTVAVEVISDALHYQTAEAATYRVYRRKDLSPANANEIVKSAMWYFNQRYTFGSYFKDSKAEDTTQFCSRLVATAYRSGGMPLTELADNKVLPVHLYQICQSELWEDITKKFEPEPLPEADKIMPPIEIPGREPLSFSEFMAETDALLLKSAQLGKQHQDVMYKSLREILKNEALLAQYCAAEFDAAKQIRLRPSLLDDAFAGRIVRILEQMEILLDLSRMPSIDLLVGNSLVNSVEGKPGVGLYAGFPTPQAVHEMQAGREAIRIFCYLLLAETGMLAILAYLTSGEKFEEFRSVPQKYADLFLAAVPPIGNLASYESEVDCFKWVEKESDRATSLTMFRNIVAALKVIELLRGSGSGED